VYDYIKPAVLENLDRRRAKVVNHACFAGYTLHLSTDGNSAIIITVLFDYCKAFDLIDHDIPNCVLLNCT